MRGRAEVMLKLKMKRSSGCSIKSRKGKAWLESRGQIEWWWRMMESGNKAARNPRRERCRPDERELTGWSGLGIRR
ncbi:hypothetical protein M0R45_018794 [Rubus argutus]|uniref:Uncharacterized protein n=1 Tax=Rubus argutus TaxID=59490 RepID=A0AAW1X3H3_RUBAR